MAEVKAFVGHSFTEDDKETVAKFCEFFDSLAKLNPAFSWVHARAAEPKQLSEKVLALIQDRTLFIGICTKKEFVFAGHRLGRIFNRLFLREDAVQSKTSDWIIQEIGLAIRRNLQLVLLVEEGMRKPGGLQGDVEYIPFERSAPEKSFTRIAEMITALGLNSDVSQTVGQIVTTTSSAIPAQRDADNEVSLTPTSDWKDDDYDFAQFRCIMRENEAQAEVVKEAYLRVGGDTALKKSIWDARNESIRLLVGKGGDFEKLRKLAEANPSNSKIKAMVARGVERFGRQKEAALLYEQAALLSDDDLEQFKFRCEAAEAYQKAGSTHETIAVLEKLRSEADGYESKYDRLLDTLRQLAEDQKDDDFSVAVLEGQMDRSPSSARTRFTLAYLHSQIGNDEMALYHYLQISPNERQAMSWNNLGAAYDSFKIKARAVAAYRKSEAMGETLAMANLGNRLLRAGFVEEANSICDKALEIENFHKNIGQLSVSLREVRDTETKSTEQILEDARPRVEFYRLFGANVGAPELDEIAGTWVGTDCLMTLEVCDEHVQFHGSFERQG